MLEGGLARVLPGWNSRGRVLVKGGDTKRGQGSGWGQGPAEDPGETTRRREEAEPERGVV